MDDGVHVVRLLWDKQAVLWDFKLEDGPRAKSVQIATCKKEGE